MTRKDVAHTAGIGGRHYPKGKGDIFNGKIHKNMQDRSPRSDSPYGGEAQHWKLFSKLSWRAPIGSIDKTGGHWSVADQHKVETSRL